MYFTDINEHAIPLFIDADILQMSFMYYKTVASLMHDINSNNSPTNLFNLFEKTSTIHSYHTRSSTSGNFHVKSSNLEIRKNSLSRFGVKLIKPQTGCDFYAHKACSIESHAHTLIQSKMPSNFNQKREVQRQLQSWFRTKCTVFS